MKIMENNEIMGKKKSISIKNEQIILDNCPWIAKKIPGTRYWQIQVADGLKAHCLLNTSCS